jgi:hypothetical protein
MVRTSQSFTQEALRCGSVLLGRHTDPAYQNRNCKVATLPFERNDVTIICETVHEITRPGNCKITFFPELYGLQSIKRQRGLYLKKIAGARASNLDNL